MKSKVYYGEYSLKHWIDLILKKNLRLPKYQRHFVWDEGKTLKLLESFNKGQFVPPVIIGSFKDPDGYHNYILDGQQRLTSILLAYLGYFPNKGAFPDTSDERTADDNDFNEESSDDSMTWTFERLFEDKEAIDTKESILNWIGQKKGYNAFDPKIKDIQQVLSETYLGFSFIVPAVDDENAQQRFYSTVFRNINIMGVKLIGQESRESLYYLNQNLYGLFNPSFAKTIKISKRFTSVPVHMDFVRYISLLSQYYHQQTEKYVAMHYSGKLMEGYYEEYIYNVVNHTKNDMFPDFDELYPHKDYQSQMEKVVNTIDLLKLRELELLSIIDMDIYYFGLIYWVFFKKKEVDTSKPMTLKIELSKMVSDIKDTNIVPNNHVKNPGALKYLRTRMRNSIDIYARYLLA